jgi:hypothetical protein
MTAQRLVLGVLLMVAMTVVGVSPAAAEIPPGAASVGSANFTKSGTTIDVPELAPCTVDGTTSASSGSVVKTGLTFGGGTSSCTTEVVNPDTYETKTKSTATGKNFNLSALVSVGGPRIRISSYTVTCSATESGTSANWSFSGMTGITGFPNPVPESWTKPITKSNGTVLANAVFNIVEKPGDGRIGVTMARITFTEASGISGSITLGTAACSPTA